MSRRRSAPRPLLFWLAAGLAALLGGTGAASAGTAAVDWDAWAEVEQIQALTTDEAGELRETTIWIIVVDGQGYIRTSGTTKWGDDVERDPEIRMRIEGREIPIRVEFVEDEELRKRIISGFREKYGFSDVMISPLRFGRARIMRLQPR